MPVHGVAAAAAEPWTRSVVRPGVPDFGLPLALYCVPNDVPAGAQRRRQVELLADRAARFGAVVESTVAGALDRRTVTVLAVALVL